MAYQISYDFGKKNRSSYSGMRRFVFTTAFFLCFLWIVSAFWPEGKELLKLLMIPGDPDRTLQAAEVFAAELSSGYSLTDAARNFCAAFAEYGFQN